MNNSVPVQITPLFVNKMDGYFYGHSRDILNTQQVLLSDIDKISLCNTFYLIQGQSTSPILCMLNCCLNLKRYKFEPLNRTFRFWFVTLYKLFWNNSYTYLRQIFIAIHSRNTGCHCNIFEWVYTYLVNE